MDIRKGFLTGVYFICGTLMFYFYTGGIYVGGFNIQYCYMVTIFFVVVAFGYFLVWPDIDRMKEVGIYLLILMVPYLITMFYSLILWTLNLTPMRIMIRGFMWPVYQLIAILMGAATVYCFGENGVYYQLTAFFAAYSLNFLRIMSAGGGPGKFITEFVQLVVSFGDNTGPMMHQVERMAYAHGMGIFLLYLVLTIREKKKNKWFLIPALLFFLSGFKRSAMLGLAVAILVAVICYFIQKWKKEYLLYGICFVLAALGIIYIGILASDDADIIIATLGINTMGRGEIYSMVRKIYEFSIVYFGRGLGYISYIIGTGALDVGNLSRGDIHNDHLRQYIELGMLGYIIWLLTFFFWRVKELVKKVDMKTGVLALVCLSYCFACYMTENMYYNYKANLALNVVILSYAYGRKIQVEECD